MVPGIVVLTKNLTAIEGEVELAQGGVLVKLEGAKGLALATSEEIAVAEALEVPSRVVEGKEQLFLPNGHVALVLFSRPPTRPMGFGA